MASTMQRMAYIFMCSMFVLVASSPGGSCPADDSSDEMSALQKNIKAHTQSWSVDCKPYPGKRVVLVTASHPYLNFFDNWLFFASKHLDSSTDQVVVVAEDEDAVKPLQNMSGVYGVHFEIYHDAGYTAGANLQQPKGAARRTWLNPVWASVVNHRPKLISRYTEQGCTVFYQDIDTAWKQPVFPVLESYGQHDVIVADDRERPKGQNMCTCLLYFQPTKATKLLLERWDEGCKKQPRNQAAFNIVMSEMEGQIDYVLLPAATFPNGKLFPNHAETAVVAHANFRRNNVTKREFLVENGLWHDETQ